MIYGLSSTTQPGYDLEVNVSNTANKLTTARNINGTSFNGSADITVTAAAGTLTGSTLNSTVTNSSLITVGTITSGTWTGTTIGLGYGGTNATSAQGATNNLAGAVTSGYYLRGNGTNVVRSAIQAADMLIIYVSKVVCQLSAFNSRFSFAR